MLNIHVLEKGVGRWVGGQVGRDRFCKSISTFWKDSQRDHDVRLRFGIVRNRLCGRNGQDFSVLLFALFLSI